MSCEKRVRYYTSYTDDFYKVSDDTTSLSEDYQWIKTDPLSKFLSAVIYGAALVFSTVYCRLFLRVRIKGAGKIRKLRHTGIFLYGNHTQPIGDVFDPALAVFPKRIYTIADPENLSLPFIGKLLPYLGALPLSGTLRGVRELNRAIEYRLQQNRCIVIYPEAHVWDYCTFIRPFPASSFKFPVKFSKPVFTATATYRKSHFFKKPTIILHIDGPFNPGQEGSNKEKTDKLRDTVFNCMVQRSKESNCCYIDYRPENQSIPK